MSIFKERCVTKMTESIQNYTIQSKSSLSVVKDSREHYTKNWVTNIYRHNKIRVYKHLTGQKEDNN